jgi:hypothetical protein
MYKHRSMDEKLDYFTILNDLPVSNFRALYVFLKIKHPLPKQLQSKFYSMLSEISNRTSKDVTSLDNNAVVKHAYIFFVSVICLLLYIHFIVNCTYMHGIGIFKRGCKKIESEHFQRYCIRGRN